MTQANHPPEPTANSQRLALMETTYSTKRQTALTERQAGFAQTERSLSMQKARYTPESTKDERESEER